MLLQAAFKRSVGSDASASTSGPCCERDWDVIKAEDKTLVHQVIIVMSLDVCGTVYNPDSSPE